MGSKSSTLLHICSYIVNFASYFCWVFEFGCSVTECTFLELN